MAGRKLPGFLEPPLAGNLDYPELGQHRNLFVSSLLSLLLDVYAGCVIVKFVYFNGVE